MSQSKIPIHAYVDEAGNTGHNVFDENQPVFLTAALITKGDFDILNGQRIADIAGRLGESSLHANHLGMDKLESICPSILDILLRQDAHFFISRVEKTYLVATKIFDTIFDSGENAAVAWHDYNLRPLRLILTFKLAMIVDFATAKIFWECLFERKEAAIKAKLVEVCERLLSRIGEVPDEASQKKLSQALEWARDHPEALQIQTDRKIARQGHFPNLVAFANLLDGLEHYSRLWRRPVAKIIHDRQSEIESTLAVWHEMFSHASAEPVKWGGEVHVLQKVAGSQFSVSQDDASAGLQVVDIILWLYQQAARGRRMPEGCQGVLSYALTHAWNHDFSFDGVHDALTDKYGDLLFGPATPDELAKATPFLEVAEARRIASMKQYEKDGIPPFAREGQPRIENDAQTLQQSQPRKA